MAPGHCQFRVLLSLNSTHPLAATCHTSSLILSLSLLLFDHEPTHTNTLTDQICKIKAIMASNFSSLSSLSSSLILNLKSRWKPIGDMGGKGAVAAVKHWWEWMCAMYKAQRAKCSSATAVLFLRIFDKTYPSLCFVFLLPILFRIHLPIVHYPFPR